MELRTLKPEDETLIKSWLEPAFKQHIAWWQDIFESSPQASIEELVNRDWEGLIATSQSNHGFVSIAEDNKPLGIVEAKVEKDPFFAMKVGVLAWIYVAREARGRGVTDDLMKAALNWMQSKQVQGKVVNVTAKNKTAVKLYEKHGFKIADYRMLGKAP